MTPRDLITALGDDRLDVPLVVRFRGRDFDLHPDAVALVAEAPMEHDGALYPGRTVARLQIV
ncbi:hypothetical protein GCM10009616_18410 [Microlunatus lacustris]